MRDRWQVEAHEQGHPRVRVRLLL